MIVLNRNPKIGKVPEYNEQQYGKIQITSLELAKYVGKNLQVEIHIYEPTDKYPTV